MLNRGADTEADAAGVVTLMPGRGAAPCRCRTGPALRTHHDRLLRVERDLDEVLELLELAVTWGELDWSSAGVVPPEQWSELVENHQWHDVDRVRRLFGLAQDVAARSEGAIRRPHSVLTTAAVLSGEL
jgi:hypothetical protein